MSVQAKESLRLSLAGRPLGPSDLIGIELAVLYQALGHRKHGDFVYRMKPPTVTEQVNSKQKETHAQGEGPIAMSDALRSRVRNHYGENDNGYSMFCQSPN